MIFVVCDTGRRIQISDRLATSTSAQPLVLREAISESPLVSVVINNYNYANFLSNAVDSVLNQTYPNVEAVVVDDGSTDGSQQVISSYGDRIVPVLKENGGQASACNAGYWASKGEIVVFLDADDVLLPETAQRVVVTFQSRPGVAKVQYRQRIIDASGKLTGEFQPPASLPLHSGDLRQRMIDLDSYQWPSTSGNAFAAAVLRQIMPIPEAVYRGSPDIYLCTLSAVFGEVISLGDPGSLYRVHGGNNCYDPTGYIDLDKLRPILLAFEDSHLRKKCLLSTIYSLDTHRVETRDINYLCSRMISLKLDPQNHPFEESLWELFAQGCLLSITRPEPEMSRGTRLQYLLWFAAMLLSPRAMAKAVGQAYFSPRKRGLRKRVAVLLRNLSGGLLK
jgi:glycosyltransferase involved in cell wall biosynthesis